MPAILNETFIEGQLMQQHAINVANQTQRAQAAFDLLSNYDYLGITGAMPSPISWDDPTSVQYVFNTSNSEITWGGNAYSTLIAEEKRAFFQYLPKFIQHCLEVYDDTYNL
jgi:hypothetical protein